MWRIEKKCAVIKPDRIYCLENVAAAKFQQNDVASLMLQDTFKVKCPIKACSVLSETEERESSNVWLHYLFVLQEFRSEMFMSDAKKTPKSYTKS